MELASRGDVRITPQYRWETEFGKGKSENYFVSAYAFPNVSVPTGRKRLQDVDTSSAESANLTHIESELAGRDSRSRSPRDKQQLLIFVVV